MYNNKPLYLISKGFIYKKIAWDLKWFKKKPSPKVGEDFFKVQQKDYHPSGHPF